MAPAALARLDGRETDQGAGVGGEFGDEEPGGVELIGDDGGEGSGGGGGGGSGEEPPADVHVGEAGTYHGAWGCVTLNEGAEMSAREEAQLLDLVTEHGLCPDGGGGDGGGGEAGTDPSEEALAVWLEVPLATPDPVIEPGWMVVGKPAFLEPGTSLTPLSESTSTPAGELELRADSHYRVDWGDPAGPGPQAYHTEGAPWPDGEITHVFQHAGAYDVTVEQVWQASWRVAGGPWHDIALQRERSATIPDFEVIEVQAVRQH